MKFTDRRIPPGVLPELGQGFSAQVDSVPSSLVFAPASLRSRLGGGMPYWNHVASW